MEACSDLLSRMLLCKMAQDEGEHCMLPKVQQDLEKVCLIHVHKSDFQKESQQQVGLVRRAEYKRGEVVPEISSDL